MKTRRVRWVMNVVSTAVACLGIVNGAAQAVEPPHNEQGGLCVPAWICPALDDNCDGWLTKADFVLLPANLRTLWEYMFPPRHTIRHGFGRFM